MAQIKIGLVMHYFDKLGVAVIKLTKGDLKIGDKVILTAKSGVKFTQKISSMQIEHAQIDIARSGDEFGLKTIQELKNKSDVLKVK